MGNPYCRHTYCAKVIQLRGSLFRFKRCVQDLTILGSDCGSVGSAVASDTRGPQFESSHRRIFFTERLSIANCVEKTKIKKKEAGNGPFFKDVTI